jgi:hypothetical protein
MANRWDGYVSLRQNNLKLYQIWLAMKGRCRNVRNKNYDRYGGRGISVCARWLEGFQNFLDDVGERPEGTSLDRINNDGNYEPSNCRWVNQKIQGENRCTTRFIEYGGLKLNISDWAKRLRIHSTTLHRRIKKFGDIEAVRKGASRQALRNLAARK